MKHTPSLLVLIHASICVVSVPTGIAQAEASKAIPAEDPLACVEHQTDDDFWGKAKVSVIGQSDDNKVVAVKETTWWENTGRTDVDCYIMSMQTGKILDETSYSSWDKPSLKAWKKLVSKHQIQANQLTPVKFKSPGKGRYDLHKSGAVHVKVTPTHLVVEWKRSTKVTEKKFKVGGSAVFAPQLLAAYVQGKQILVLVRYNVRGKGTTVNQSHVVTTL